MPYVTVRQLPRNHQVSWMDIVLGKVSNYEVYTHGKTGDTVTRYILDPTERYRSMDADRLVALLEDFAARHADLYAQDRASLYRHYRIPKRSGGFRPIDEPLPPLMAALRELKDIFEVDFGALHHTAAFAYVKGRSTLDAVKRHQQNQSRWFLKTDFSNFFGSTTKAFAMDMLSGIFPFNEVCRTASGRNALDRAIDLCFLNGGLPQGTPISPLLVNILNVPIDHALTKALREKHFVYTRYADDILISSRYDFDWRDTVRMIEGVLRQFHAPYVIKPEKTRYGSSSGRNWNLGVMLTKDNRITIGRKKKEHLKATVNSYILDRRNGRPWDVGDVRGMAGLLSYYHMVEPDYIDKFIAWVNARYGVDLRKMIHDDIA